MIKEISHLLHHPKLNGKTFCRKANLHNSYESYISCCESSNMFYVDFHTVRFRLLHDTLSKMEPHKRNNCYVSHASKSQFLPCAQKSLHPNQQTRDKCLLSRSEERRVGKECSCL